MKNTSLLIRTLIILGITLAGIYLVFAPRAGSSVAAANSFSWEGIKQNLANNINLGLDLKGGSHLVMRVKTEEYLKTLTENDRDAALNAAKSFKGDDGSTLPVADASSIAENGTYQITLNGTDASQNAAIIDAVKKKVDLVNWTQSESGNSIVWNLPVQAQTKLKEQATDQALKIIESRINAFGVKEPTLQRQGRSDSGQILLQMPGVDDPERVKALIGTDARLELAKVVEPFQVYKTEDEAKQSLGGVVPPNRKILPYMDRDTNAAATTDAQKANQPSGYVVLESPPIVDGSEIRDASAYSGAGGGNYQISFNLKPAGAQKMGEFTRANIGKNMAIVLGDQVKSAPTIQGAISDSGQITGRFTKTSAEDLALTLKSGALPARLEYQEERTVGPSLGADSIRSGVAASIGGLVLVVLFMLFYYRGSGINAVIALVLNMLLTMAALIVFKSTLTLPGIAGLILGIGMAVDSNVLIFERIREELRLGFDVPKSIDLGFDRAFITIIDTHITTIISSVILYMYGSGPIKGFAVTLILGLLINLFSAVFVSRTIFMWLLSRKRRMEKLSI